MLLPKPQRVRSRAYLDSFADKPCEVCGSVGTTVAAHIRAGHAAGVAMKPDDWRVLALCHRHHDEFDREWSGDPLWILRNIVDPMLRRRFEKWQAKA